MTANRFNQLLQALESGWEIDEPVLIRPTWQTRLNQSNAYHFILRQRSEDKTMVLSIPDSPQLQTFLDTNRISSSHLI